MNLYKFSFQSEVKAVNPLVKKTLKQIKNHFSFISLEEEGDLCLVLSELLYNAVIHGNKQNAEKIVDLYVEIKENSVRCVVADEGFGFDYKRFLDRFKNMENKNIILESDHGRGILLAVSLSDGLTFNSKGNEVTFKKYLNSGAGRDE